MRCETPWSASSGTTRSASTTARPMSPAASAARKVRERKGARTFSAQLLGHDVLEGCPREYREDRVVEREKEQISARFRSDRRADAAHDERHREGEEQERQEHLSRAGGRC